jgi:hypothetical protein
MKGNLHVPFWSRAGVATPRLRQQSFARLHRAGWSVGDVRLLTAEGPRWYVSVTNGENAIEARAPTQAEA